MGIEETLQQWGCSDAVIATFKDNQIEEHQLPYLTEQMLKELIPLVGPRMNVQQKIMEMKCNMTTITRSDISEYTVNGSVNSDTENAPLVIASSEQPIIIENEDLFNFLRPKFEDFDLKTLLLTSPLGKSIINYYGTNKKLDNTRRNRLVSIIIKHLYNYIVKNRLCQEDYNSLGAKIIGLFPSETLGVYYCPPIRKAEHPLKKSIMAKGKLVNQVRNILFRSGDTISRRTNRLTTEKHEVEDSHILSTDNDKELFDDDVVWLKHNTDPWDKVLEKWRRTYPLRISSTVRSVDEYFKCWPILNDLRAHVLINLDFEKLYPQSHIAFHLKWELVFNKILNYKIQEVKDINAQNLYKQLSEKTDEEEKLPLQLTLLNYLLPPRGRTKNWKFSTLESIEGLLLHVENPGDIQTRVNERIKKAYDRNWTVQPYLLVEGNTLNNIRTTYVVFDRVKYQFLSITEAFDLLFKSYHALNIKYPPQSAHVLQLIQQTVYNINTKYDVVYPDNLEILRLLLKD